MNKNAKELFALSESDKSLVGKIQQQETMDAAYATAKEAVHGLTMEEFREWAMTASALGDDELAAVSGGAAPKTPGWNSTSAVKSKDRPDVL